MSNSPIRILLVPMLSLLAASALLLPAASAAAQESGIEGFTEPYRQIDLGPPEQGTLASLAVRKGDRVEKGQLLGSLDCEVLLVSLKIAQANKESRGRLDSALAERDMRTTRLEKLEDLRERGHASLEEVDRARADLAIAAASVLTAEEQQRIDALEYEKMQAMIERRILRSPIAGIVTRVHREEKEFVTASSPTVLTIVQLDPLEITFNVPTGMADGIAAGQKIDILFPDSGKQVKGKVDFVAPVTEADSDTVRVKVLLNNPRGQHRSGVRCTMGTAPPSDKLKD